MSYDDAMARAVRNKFAPDIMTTLRDTPSTELHSPRTSINLPVRADTMLIYDKGLAAFTVEGRIHRVNKNECLMGRSVFSTHELTSGRDSSLLIDYLFDRLKEQFKQTLAAGELEKLLDGAATKD